MVNGSMQTWTAFERGALWEVWRVHVETAIGTYWIFRFGVTLKLVSCDS